jgi:hypothetical protein
MLDIAVVIEKINNELVSTFKEVDNWFNLPEDTRNYRPISGG